MNLILVAIIAVSVVFLITLVWLIKLRRVVKPNEVHILRKGSKTVVYGAGDEGDSTKNSYYQFPEGIPMIGVNVIKLPLSIFDVELSEYSAYDKDRVPFVVDVKAFFRIANFKKAAERVSNVNELETQLTDIVRGAVRSILAMHVLNDIMEDRSTYGKDFTDSIKDQLSSWGVEPVKAIELMDVRDAKGENVIADIMEKKKSKISMESRTEVAKNEKIARDAEIESRQSIEIKEQDAKSLVGKREADVLREVNVAKEKAKQDIEEAAKTTKEKEMAVLQMDTVRRAEIEKDKVVVEAESRKKQSDIDKLTKVVNAEAEKESIRLNAEAKYILAEKKAEADFVAAKKEAEGNLAVAENEAKGTEAKGKADAVATEAQGTAEAISRKLLESAAVEGQVILAKEIGSNDGYQSYLVNIRQVEASEKIGIEQAKNLSGADVKIISQNGTVADGIKSVSDVFSPKGGVAASTFLESFGSNGVGKTILDKLGLNDDKNKTNSEPTADAKFEDVD